MIDASQHLSHMKLDVRDLDIDFNRMQMWLDRLLDMPEVQSLIVHALRFKGPPDEWRE